jgi:hypothetical protein
MRKLATVKNILHSFGLAFILTINPHKCVAYPIRCEELILVW